MELDTVSLPDKLKRFADFILTCLVRGEITPERQAASMLVLKKVKKKLF